MCLNSCGCWWLLVSVVFMRWIVVVWCGIRFLWFLLFVMILGCFVYKNLVCEMWCFVMSCLVVCCCCCCWWECWVLFLVYWFGSGVVFFWFCGCGGVVLFVVFWCGVLVFENVVLFYWLGCW